MIITLYILLFLAIWHILYENLISTSLRHGLKYDFFKLRDDLRNLKINNELSQNENEIYTILDESICNIINSIPLISLGNYFLMKKLSVQNNKNNFEYLDKLIEETNNLDLNEIHKKTTYLAGKAIIINSGGWFMYAAPFALIVVLISLFFSQLYKISDFLKKVSSKLIYNDENLFHDCRVSQ